MKERKALHCMVPVRFVLCSALTLLLLLAPFAKTAAEEMTKDVSSEAELISALNGSYEEGSKLTINLNNHIKLSGTNGIDVCNTLSELVINLNGYDIDGNGNPFLNVGKNSRLKKLVLQNDSTDREYTYQDGNLTINPPGKITNCSRSETYESGAVLDTSIYCDGLEVVLKDIEFSQCVADGYGGVAFLNGTNCSFSADGCKFINNGANEFSGGALHFFSDCTSRISYCLFEGNHAWNGGAVCIDGEPVKKPGSLTIDHSVFSGNSSDDDAGALLVNGLVNLLVDNCLFTENSTEGRGGAIYEQDANTAIIRNSVFTGNHTEDEGGALYFSPAESAAEITGCKILGNTAAYYGGGISLFSNTSLKMKDSIVSENKSEYAGGGVFVDYGDVVSMDQVTISQNQGSSGGGIYVFYDPEYAEQPTQLNLTECAVTNNTAENRGSGVYIADGSVLTVNHTKISDNTAQVGKDAALADAAVITVKGNLGSYICDVAKIDAINANPTTGVVTSGLPGYGGIANFASQEKFGVRLTAGGEAQLVRIYPVTLYPNGGTIAGDKDVTEYAEGEGAVLPAAGDISLAGFVFEGWYNNEGCTGAPVTAIASSETGNKEFWAKWTARKYSVRVLPGTRMAQASESGDLFQQELTGPMTTVILNAENGYCFPEDYQVQPVGGISVTRVSDTQIMISGIPAEDVEIALPGASRIVTPTPTPEITETPSPTPEVTPTLTPEVTETPSPIPVITPTPTLEASATPTQEITPTPAMTPETTAPPPLTPTPVDPASPSPTATLRKLPNTGDPSDPILWAGLIILGILIAGVVLKRRSF